METKVPFYSIVNIFLPGLVLLGSCVLLFIDEVKALVQVVTNLGSAGLEVLITVSLLAISYEAGYVIFRFGSAAIEPILKKVFDWTEYSDFIAAGKTSEKAHDKLEMLSREYGYARTQMTLYIILAILTGILTHWWIMGGSILCVALFTVTARGHMKKIQEAVRQYLVANGGTSKINSG